MTVASVIVTNIVYNFLSVECKTVYKWVYPVTALEKNILETDPEGWKVPFEVKELD